MVKVEKYTGPTPKFHKGRAENPETTLIRQALTDSADSGGLRKLTGLTSRELEKFPPKIRAVAGKEGLSVSVDVQGDAIVFVASRKEPKDAEIFSDTTTEEVIAPAPTPKRKR